MKLYRNIKKRTAKKHLGKCWYKLQEGRSLRVGDLVSSCRGWNEKIAEIYPEWSGRGRFTNRYVVDFAIVTESGCSCSLTHCCSFPLETKDEIISYWMEMDTPEYQRWYQTWSPVPFEETLWGKIVQGLRRGEEVFLEDGTINTGFLPEKK